MSTPVLNVDVTTGTVAYSLFSLKDLEIESSDVFYHDDMNRRDIRIEMVEFYSMTVRPNYCLKQYLIYFTHTIVYEMIDFQQG